MWNGKRFSIYDNEEKTVLRMMKDLGDQTNFNMDSLEGKTDKLGNHEGSWQGLDKPTLSEEGMRAIVEGLVVQLPQNMINVKYPPSPLVGAVGDGVANDTTAINTIVQHIKTNKMGGMFFPEGTYMIDGVDMTDIDITTRNKYGGILIDAPMRIMLHPNAILKAITNDQQGYCVLNIHDTHNVIVEGGTILGDRLTHPATGGEQGHGIKIITCHDIIIRDIEIRDCWGDGILVYFNNAPYVQNFNFLFENVTVKNVRRNAMSICDGRDFKIVNCDLSDTNGTSPQAGIDFEADYVSPGIALPMYNMTIEKCIFRNNVEQGISFGAGLGMTNTIIKDNIFEGNGKAINLIGKASSIVTDIIVENNIIKIMGRTVGVELTYADKIKITNNIIYDNAGLKSAKAIVLGLACNSINIEGNKMNNLDYGVYYVDSTTTSRIKVIKNEFLSLNKPIQGGGYGFEFTENTCEFFTSDCSIYAQHGKICNNKFANSDIDAVYGTFSNCLISGNEFSDIANTNKATYPMLIAGLLENCFVNGNYFNSTASQMALQELNAHTIPSVISNNFAMSTNSTSSFGVQGGTVVIDNYTQA